MPNPKLAFYRRVMSDVNTRFLRFKQDVLRTLKPWIEKEIDQATAPLNDQIEQLASEVRTLTADNKLLHQKLLQFEGDSEAAISLCKQQLEKIDLLVAFVSGEKGKLEKQFFKEGRNIRETWRLLQLLEELNPHDRKISLKDGEDITDLVGSSGFGELLRKELRG
ncbi:hypothetical protein N836_28915 [Leptolyngbya sp. Heron Island J]|nr:hypothetical protein N836_28915 [Leptolyngbya sp. Heron Island J]